MGTVLASVILNRAATTLLDTGATRWTQAELLDWLNAGQWELAAIAGDPFAVYANATLAAGTRQAAPTDSVLLLRATRNMGAAGTTPGAPIRTADLRLMDAAHPTWHNDSQDTVTRNFFYDPTVRDVYWVHPPAAAGQKIELQYVRAPAAVASVSNPISVPDVYQNALLHYVLFAAYMKEAEVEGMSARATAHRQAFESQTAQIARPAAAAAKPEPSA